MIRILAFILLASPALGTEAIVTGLSQNKVQITADFTGSDILVYGAVKRDAPVPTGTPLEVIVTLEGPSTPVIVRRKQRVAGIWVNGDAVRIGAAPSFYAVTTTGPLDQILSKNEDLRYGITLSRSISTTEISVETMDFPLFTQALRRIRASQDRYRISSGTVQLVEDTLFRTDFALPANVTEGVYTVRLFILREGLVIDSQERVINVRKTGIERYLYNLAHQKPLLYGIISLLMAAIAGWAASEIFRFARR